MAEINWPIPPVNFDNYDEDGFIPEKMTLFNVGYVYREGRMEQEMEYEEVDRNRNRVRKMVDESFRAFGELLTGFDPLKLDRIVQIHTEINEVLNKGKKYEKEECIAKARRKQREFIEKISSRINELLYAY
ncbi:hypothetical protein ECANGB1_2336 [Enterospora canceri]|uniref:Mediator of RNA polymerase II transcription subunit 7 n=1 Tax=Enterospora canceri TaxID=1081671 RepID=A0A1Y1S8L0_9MICR|nr:hypothetical protein ECANGB1_2336 [Enterospora canceri]